MPMFDDPQRELNRLQQELLAQEADWEEEEDLLPGDFDEELDDILELIGESPARNTPREPVYRNYANGYGQNRQTDWEDDPEEDPDFYPQEAEPPRQKKKEKGIRGLVFLAILETLGILAIAAWWVKFLWL